MERIKIKEENLDEILNATIIFLKNLIKMLEDLKEGTKIEIVE